MIIDSHCHLDFPELYDNLPEILKRADDAGVKKILTICTKLKNEPQIRKISSNNPSVYYAVGTHPMSAADEPMATVDQQQEPMLPMLDQETGFAEQQQQQQNVGM